MDHAVPVQFAIEQCTLDPLQEPGYGRNFTIFCPKDVILKRGEKTTIDTRVATRYPDGIKGILHLSKYLGQLFGTHLILLSTTLVKTDQWTQISCEVKYQEKDAQLPEIIIKKGVPLVRLEFTLWMDPMFEDREFELWNRMFKEMVEREKIAKSDPKKIVLKTSSPKLPKIENSLECSSSSRDTSSDSEGLCSKLASLPVNEVLIKEENPGGVLIKEEKSE